MEPRQPGNKNMPDFEQLNDRIIAESSPSPMLVIKTNLDPKDTSENNPYYHDTEEKNAKAMKEYFQE
ncbi:hypothetical protein [Bacillus sp. AFS031507]|uniref:hypothetical protein n=1 Tax=Bacillus sp. AFS031507 TaxID=2033496 RepID=UPI000BFC0312|nr:hypothetical protein [Bacillus sp. AFS031507]PGY10730.1 hypothetical protein COE25_13250 [Bacillus sp. AFS031507]